MTDAIPLNSLPITIEAVDESNNTPTSLFSYVIPFSQGLDVQDYLERAFVFAQTTKDPDPFVFSLRFYGYDLLSVPRTGFLGYEIESLGKGKTVLTSSAAAYWELFIDGHAAGLGSDLLCPEPGAQVTWRFIRAGDTAPRSLRSRLVAASTKS